MNTVKNIVERRFRARGDQSFYKGLGAEGQLIDVLSLERRGPGVRSQVPDKGNRPVSVQEKDSVNNRGTVVPGIFSYQFVTLTSRFSGFSEAAFLRAMNKECEWHQIDLLFPTFVAAREVRAALLKRNEVEKEKDDE